MTTIRTWRGIQAATLEWSTQDGGSEYTRALDEIDRLRALVNLAIRRGVEGDIPCVPPPCADD